MPATSITHERAEPSQAAHHAPVTYYPALDGLRAVAFLMVFAHHTGPYIFRDSAPIRMLPNLEAGLPIFFVLSSFLITELLLRERERFGTVHVRAFFARRALRIWPLYFAFIACAFIFYRFHAPELLTPKNLLCLYLLSGNVYIYTHGWPLAITGPLWSISIEEQFYLLWPALGKLWGRRGYAILSVCIAVVSVCALHHMGAIHAQRYKVWTNSFVQFEFFALGAALALLLHNRRLALPAAARVVLAVAAAACIGFLQIDDGAKPFHVMLVEYLLLSLACALLLVSVYRMNVPRRLNFWLYLGRISYGMYVFHLMAIKAVLYAAERWQVQRLGLRWRVVHVTEAALSLLLTIAIAALSYRFFESPFLRLKSRFEFVKTRTV
jgi:peptidoglycan/LPS O-acetylase OafA/YrhL